MLMQDILCVLWFIWTFSGTFIFIYSIYIGDYLLISISGLNVGLNGIFIVLKLFQYTRNYYLQEYMNEYDTEFDYTPGYDFESIANDYNDITVWNNKNVL